MITGGHARLMARYGRWQNRRHAAAIAGLDAAALRRDRGAFFGSILGTANHLLWGDTTWIARFDGGEGVTCGIPRSPELHPDFAAWASAREAMDGRIMAWAAGLPGDVLRGDLTWFSGVMQQEVRKPLAMLVVHFFNHQTHHRGQIHAMLTAQGADPGVTDLFFMPEDA